MSTPEPTGEAAEIWAAQLDMYEGFTTGDRPRIDRHISPDGTMWDSAHEPLIRGIDGLNAVRAARPTQGVPSVSALEATDPVITVWGDTAVSRHLLTVRFDDPAVPVERIRNTGVWRRIGGVWLNVHNHEDVLP